MLGRVEAYFAGIAKFNINKISDITYKDIPDEEERNDDSKRDREKPDGNNKNSTE